MITEKIIKTASVIIVYIGFWIPCLFTVYTSRFYSQLEFSSVVVYFLLAITLALLNSLINKKIIFTILLFITTTFFSMLSFAELAHLITFDTGISISSIHIALETNYSESIEFFSMYLSSKLYLLAAIYLISILLGVVFSYIQFDKIKSPKNGFVLLTKILLLFICITYLTSLKKYFLPFSTLEIVREYQKERDILSEIDITKKGDFKRVIHIGDEEPETHVLVIGESTTNHHMSLYGYNRETNPLLSKRKESLSIFKHVISPHTHTIASLSKVLTLGDYDNPQKKHNNTVIQLLNAAGFKTYWISNQKPVGLYETSTRLISKMCDQSVFTDMSTIMFDEKIFEPLRQVLDEDVKKKFIIVHLMGTHLAYSERYPEKFNVFNTIPLTKFNHNLAYKTINEYDNAVLYNDYIVNGIIEEVEKKNKSSYILYFSDHGEDVYESMNQSCHTETNGSKPMFDVPMILWMSKHYKKKNSDLHFDINRKYCTEDLIHTIADLSRVSFSKFDSTRSIVNHSFKEYNRLILGGEDYDKLFEK